MKLCIDHADISKIRRIYEFYPADGVSTNHEDKKSAL